MHIWLATVPNTHSGGRLPCSASHAQRGRAFSTWPGAQAMQSEAWSLPTTPTYFPASHLMQFVDAANSWYMPSGQGVHHSAPSLRGRACGRAQE